MALETSLEKPAPVRVIANAMSSYIQRLGPIWVEGQIAQLSRRSTSATVFLTLRDPVAEVSVQVTCARSTFDALPTPVTEGARVVVFARFQYYVPRGTLSLNAREIRPVGVGELLARIEQRRQLLAAEGLFDPDRKQRLPFLPQRIGLVVGRNSAAERDVVDNAQRRWPGVDFRIEYATVQGHDAARQVIEALVVLDNDPAVDVIVVARGGGALEDLLPFSDEGLLRAAVSCRTPIVSAIGHESDQPLFDLVADLRASTPTDAAKQVIPDVREELNRITRLREQTQRVVRALVEREQHGLAAARSRPALAAPSQHFDQLSDVVNSLRDRSRRCLNHQLNRASDEVGHRFARVRSLSPLATLQRGYAVLQTPGGDIITEVGAVSLGEVVEARLASGRLTATVTATSTAEDTDEEPT